MKFQKYLQDAQRNSGMLRHLNYKALKAEVKRLAEAVGLGMTSSCSAAHSFGKQLEAELTEVGCSWEMRLWQLRDMVDELSSTSDMMLRGDAAHGALSEEMRPLTLLEPLQAWLPVAAFADALRRHRLLQMTAVVKIEKKFVKVVGAQLRSGFKSPELLLRSALSSSLIHDLCARLERAGDMLLRLGLGTAPPEVEEDQCSICLSELVDPARLPCGHRFCVHCVMPLFGGLPDDGLDAVLLRCPLCRAAGPDVPQALCLDGLLARLGRGMRADICIPCDDDSQQFTAVVASSLARLAARAGPAAPDKPSSPVSKEKEATCKHMRNWADESLEDLFDADGCLSAESLATCDTCDTGDIV
eukprot:TRINITY_DN16533_c0_g1_i1.p1 TRINITY_DN16533_c0_g1~~TRINITY_DN16533_c0_g1_i1.p1  ORF type:complete len:358 (-),score=81.67 TRINITY_DN16533_c0_g1_i1:184-1257(-)